MDTAVAVAMIGSVMAVLTAVAALLTTIYKRGQHEGRVTEILSRLTAITADHEARLRTLETRGSAAEG